MIYKYIKFKYEIKFKYKIQFTKRHIETYNSNAHFDFNILCDLCIKKYYV